MGPLFRFAKSFGLSQYRVALPQDFRRLALANAAERVEDHSDHKAV